MSNVHQLKPRHGLGIRETDRTREWKVKARQQQLQREYRNRREVDTETLLEVIAAGIAMLIVMGLAIILPLSL